MGGRLARVVATVIVATGLVTTSPTVAHAAATTECATGIDTEASTTSSPVRSVISLGSTRPE